MAPWYTGNSLLGKGKMIKIDPVLLREQPAVETCVLTEDCCGKESQIVSDTDLEKSCQFSAVIIGHIYTPIYRTYIYVCLPFLPQKGTLLD